jgi:DNA-binding PadR family transcriptional regulator
LLAFAIEYEEETKVALAIGANILRVIAEGRAIVRDLPRLSGVSKEAVATSLSFLEKSGFATTKPESSGRRTKVVELTEKGQASRREYLQLVGAIESRWRSRFGKAVVEDLRRDLEALVIASNALFAGIEPYPDNWRASLPKLENLPHYPMVLHRGGFPDGS